MNERVRDLLERIKRLEEELREELLRSERHVLYEIKGRKLRFEERLLRTHRELRMGLLRRFRHSRPQNALSAPVIYAMIVPLAFLDLCLSVYQGLCFPLYRMGWCPIKHARKLLSTHARYPRFLDYGDATDYHAELERLRRELIAEGR